MSYTVMIVAAAGNSTRMGQPKQALPLNGKPVLLHTLTTLQEVDSIDEIMLIARPEDKAPFALMAADNGITKLQHVVAGGNTRQQSVANGLALLPPEVTLVGIHDGARPLVTPSVVEAVIRTAQQTGAAAAAVPVKDTLKRTNDDGVIAETVARQNLWHVQTPQVFAAAPFRAAMEAATEDFTDDCQLMEKAGYPVTIVPGLDTNLKLTTPEDLLLAQAILNIGRKESTPMRIGHGYDVHRLVDGRPLILGGVAIPHSKGLLGHSDADVLTHAIMDALLGAAAMGDIGKLFPDNDPAYAGANSVELLCLVIRHIRAAGYRVANIDATVLAQKPKLAPHILAMRQRLADACGVPLDALSVKATTEEGLGFTGTMEGIAAHAVCLLTK